VWLLDNHLSVIRFRIRAHSGPDTKQKLDSQVLRFVINSVHTKRFTSYYLSTADDNNKDALEIRSLVTVVIVR